MSRNPTCTVYIGNLDEKVNERVLYEILIQVGRIVDLYIPRDKETNRHKGYAFAEYETEEIANYAVRLFSGVVRLCNKTVKFAISGQDKLSQNNAPSAHRPNLSAMPMTQSPLHLRETEYYRESSRLPVDQRVSGYTSTGLSVFPQATPNGILNKRLIASNYEQRRRPYGSLVSTSNRTDSGKPSDNSSVEGSICKYFI